MRQVSADRCTAVDEAPRPPCLRAALGPALPDDRESAALALDRVRTVLTFPPEVRRGAYTTNLIESMSARLRKVIRNRGQFPTEQAALKVLYLAVRNLGEYRDESLCQITVSASETVRGSG